MQKPSRPRRETCPQSPTLGLIRTPFAAGNRRRARSPEPPTDVLARALVASMGHSRLQAPSTTQRAARPTLSRPACPVSLVSPRLSGSLQRAQGNARAHTHSAAATAGGRAGSVQPSANRRCGGARTNPRPSRHPHNGGTVRADAHIQQAPRSRSGGPQRGGQLWGGTMAARGGGEETWRWRWRAAG